MSLVLTLTVTAQPPNHLGTVSITRADHLDETAPGFDTECVYTVRFNGRTAGTVRHRYGDDAWTLAWKATELITEWFADGRPTP
jgi:hypothetical protein